MTEIYCDGLTKEQYERDYDCALACDGIKNPVAWRRAVVKLVYRLWLERRGVAKIDLGMHGELLDEINRAKNGE